MALWRKKFLKPESGLFLATNRLRRERYGWATTKPYVGVERQYILIVWARNAWNAFRESTASHPDHFFVSRHSETLLLLHLSTRYTNAKHVRQHKTSNTRSCGWNCPHAVKLHGYTAQHRSISLGVREEQVRSPWDNTNCKLFNYTEAAVGDFNFYMLWLGGVLVSLHFRI